MSYETNRKASVKHEAKELQKQDMEKAFNTLRFLYRSGLLLFSVKYLLMPFMHIYESMIYSYVGRQIEPGFRWFDAKALGPLMGWVLFALHVVLRFVLLATYPLIHVLVRYVILPTKRQAIRGLNKIRETSAQIDAESAKDISHLETIASQKHSGTMPSTDAMALKAEEDHEYDEETFQFTKIEFKLFYNRLQYSFFDAQYLWGFGPRDTATDARLGMDREVLNDKREYLLAVREHDQRIENAMKKQRMAEAAKDGHRNGDTESETDVDHAVAGAIAENVSPLTRAQVTSDKKTSIAEVIGDIATKVKIGLGFAENDIDIQDENAVEGTSPIAEDISSPPTPPKKPSPKDASKILSPETAALDARVRTADRLSAVAITPYTAAAVAKVQRSERKEVEMAFAKKRKQKKLAYQKTHFMDRLKNVLGIRSKIRDQHQGNNEEEEETSSTISTSSKESIKPSAPANTNAVTPVEVTEGDIYIAKDATTEKDKVSEKKSAHEINDKVKEEKEANSKLPDFFNKGQIPDPSQSFIDRLLGRENESQIAEETTDTLLTEIKNPLATRKSSRMVKDDDQDEVTKPKSESSPEDEESIQLKEEEAMRKRRMEYAQEKKDEETAAQQEIPIANEQNETEQDRSFASILKSGNKQGNTASNLNHSQEEHNESTITQVSPQRRERRASVQFSSNQISSDSKQLDDSQSNSKPSHLDKEEIMSAYHNPFLKGKHDTHSMSMNEEGASSNDITPLTRSANSTENSVAHDLRIIDQSTQFSNNTGPRTTTQPALHPFFLLPGGNQEAEDDENKYMRIVSELNPF